MTTKLQEFYLLRHEDVNGKSGTGIVALGVKFPNGQTALQWMTYTNSLTIFHTMEDLMEVHGHGGKTEVIMGPVPCMEEKKPRKKKSK